MFSGIIEELGEVRARASGRLDVRARTAIEGVAIGESIAVDGACLTVVELSGDGFIADVMPETERRTTLGGAAPGRRVNLERSLALGDRIGGHLVTGHVDATGAVTSVRDDGNARWVTVEAPPALLELVAEKGCIAVDGVSLTVVDVFASAFTVSLIPHTLETTTAGSWAPGKRVNLEADLIARYVHRAQEVRSAAGAPRDTINVEV